MKNRRDIPKEYKWDLSAIYPTEEDFLAEYKRTEGLIADFASHKSSMLESAEQLYSALRALADIEELIDKLWIYSSLSFYVDTTDNEAQSRNTRVRDLAVKAGEATWFVSPYLMRLGGERTEKYISEYPALESFRRMLYKNLRYAPYTLSDDCEKLYAGLEDCLHLHSGLRSIFAISDLRFGKIRDAEGKSVELTDTNYIPFMMSRERRVRRAAFRTLYKTYETFGNTFATMYQNHVKECVTLARVRGYSSSLAASTFRDEVTPEIYENLISTVNESLPVLFEYYELKRRALGLSRLHIYDIYTPLIGEIDDSYTYDEARAEVVRTAEALGDEYAEVLRSGLYERGWVDVYPSRGKRGGAFSSGCPATEPYILMNFNGTLDDISTLAHEAGHSMHSYYSQRANEPHNSAYTLFVAEVASTVNELLFMRRRLRESASDTERLYILNQIMELYKSTLFRQTMLAEFERDAHAMAERGEPLTRDAINATYYGIVKRYFGEGVVCDPEIAYEWARIPHFYTSFYVYKYATCISAASAIVERIENEGKEYTDKYIDFLKCGDSRSPCDSLLVAGIDMTSPEVVRSAVASFAAAVKEFREIYERSLSNGK